MLRSYATGLQKKGWLDGVLARVPPDSAKLLQKPPLPLSWVDAPLVDAIASAIAAAHGRDALRDLLHGAMQDSMGPILKPLVTGTLALFGGGPETLFARLDLFATTLTRGVTFSWTPADGKSGTILIAHDEPAPDAIYAAWEGSLLFTFDVTGAKGTLGKAEVVNGGRNGRIAASWS
ncbi:MAG: hypothetical protein ACXWLM_03665 [Myxococcales bacterium]